MVRQFILTLGCVLLTAGCTSTPGETSSENGFGTDQLKPRNIAVGECGVFVWTADQFKRFILFSQAESISASWWTTEGEVNIKRLRTDGSTAFGQSPIQVFGQDDGTELKLSLRDPQEVDNGTRYKSGAITLMGADGWEKVIPVIGMAACNLSPIVADYSVRTIQ